jgi:WD40 repeat protein
VSLVLAVRTAPYFQPAAQHNDGATSAATSTTSRNSSNSSMTASVIPSLLSGGNSSHHRREQPDSGRLNLRDFALGQSSSHHAPVTRDTSNVNVVITDVAWSIGKSKSTLRKRRESDDDTNQQHAVGANEGVGNDGDEDDCDYVEDVDLDSAWTMNDAGTAATRKTSEQELQSSFIAAAGSNGTIVVWSAGSLLGLSAPPTVGVGDVSSTSGRRAASSSPSKSSVLVPPEAELSLHTRQVNRLAWHPTHYGWLLSASQDGTVLLWERAKRAPSSRSATNSAEQAASALASGSSDASQKTATPRFRGLFGGFATAASVQQQQQQLQRSSFRPIAGKPQKSPPPNVHWHCRSTFLPKSEAVRDIRWSPFYDDGTWMKPPLHPTTRFCLRA